jgi:hypothetical protein
MKHSTILDFSLRGCFWISDYRIRNAKPIPNYFIGAFLPQSKIENPKAAPRTKIE